MPRAYCSQCGAEVPVDPEGRCHLGHEVDVSPSGSTLEVELDAAEAADPDEPQPWVASVDETTLGGFTPPPPDVPTDEPDDTGRVELEDVDSVDRQAGEDLPPSRQPAATPPTETDAWRPPTADPAGPGPQPPPVPVDQPVELEDDFDLDDLEAAVAELDGGAGAVREDGPTAAPPRSAPPSPPSSATEPSSPAPAAAADDWDEEDEGDEDAADADGRDDPGSPPVDLRSFTASGEPADGGDGGKRRRFGFGR